MKQTGAHRSSLFRITPHFRFLSITLLSCLAVLLEPFCRRAIVILLCSIFSFNSLTWGGSLANISAAQAALPEQASQHPPAIADLAAPFSSHPLLIPQKTADICLPIVGCVKAPVPSVIEKPLENAAKQELYKVLRNVIKDEVPISGTEHKFYEKFDELPGRPFSPTPLDLTSIADNQAIPPGDYEIPAHFYCTKVYTLNGSGNRYVLAQLDGKMADVLSALYQRASTTGAAVQDVQILSWSIQAGVPYSDLSQRSKALVDQLIPEYRDRMDVGFYEKVLRTWDKISSQTGLPSLNQVLGELGGIGEVAQSLLRARQEIISTSFAYRPLADAFVIQQNTNSAGEMESAPWSQVDEQLFMRFLAPKGALHDGVVQVRLLEKTPVNDKMKAVEPGQTFAAVPALVLPVAGGIASAGLRQLIMGVVGIAAAAGVQSITASMVATNPGGGGDDCFKPEDGDETPTADQKLRAPARRHYLNKVDQGTLAKDVNTVIEPRVNVAVDVAAINNGVATRIGGNFLINGRTYGVHNGTLYPISGTGFYTLDRGAFKALGVYNQFGNTPRAAEILDKMGISDNTRQQALNAWQVGQRCK